jgi:diacylglycerol O-acyltransferase
MQQLSGLDASMLYMETPQTPNHVAGFYTYDPSTAPGGAVSFDASVRNVQARLGLSKTFRRTLVRVPFSLDHPYWVEDDHFDIASHVHDVKLDAPGSWPQLCDLVEELYARPIDLRRPPWEMYVIEGMGDGVDGIPHGGFAVLTKIHHAAVDGVSGMELLTVLHDHEPDAQPAPATPWSPERRPNPLVLLNRAAINNLMKPMHALRVARRLAPVAVRVPLGIRRGELQAPPGALPKTRFNGPVSSTRSIDALRIPLDQVRQARSSVPGSTVNDVVLTIVGGALRRYLGGKGELPDESLICLVPISTRTTTEAGAGGNMVAMMTARLFTNEPDPVKRLALVNLGMRDVKELADAIGGRTLAEVSDAVPGLLLGTAYQAQSRLAARNRGRILANTTVTNVPGPTHPLYFTGARVVGPYGAGPFPHGMGLIHLVGSYAGQLTFSFTADRHMLPDREKYAADLRDSIAEVCGAPASASPAAPAKAS